MYVIHLRQGYGGQGHRTCPPHSPKGGGGSAANLYLQQGIVEIIGRFSNFPLFFKKACYMFGQLAERLEVERLFLK